MPGSLFDTDVLLDTASLDTAKADRAEALIAGGGVVSVRVLNEFANVARRNMGASWTETRATTALGTMKPSLLLDQHRDTIRRAVAAHRASNPRVFGSVLHGEDTGASDLDLLVDPEAGMSLFDPGAIRWELRTLLGVPVDVVTPRALPESFRAEILATAFGIIAPGPAR